MTEYIKRSDILDTTRLLDTDIVRQDKTASWLLDQILYDIEHTPAADAVPVIRCKDCLYSRGLNRNDPHYDRYAEGRLWCRNLYEVVCPVDYCYMAVRKEAINGN